MDEVIPDSEIAAINSIMEKMTLRQRIEFAIMAAKSQASEAHSIRQITLLEIMSLLQEAERKTYW